MKSFSCYEYEYGVGVDADPHFGLIQVRQKPCSYEG